jgi:hypothetical protein
VPLPTSLHHLGHDPGWHITHLAVKKKSSVTWVVTETNKVQERCLRCKSIVMQGDTAASQGKSRTSVLARPAYEAAVKEDYYDCYVVMKVPTNTTINLLEIGVPHLSFLGCFLQCCSYKLPGTTL